MYCHFIHHVPRERLFLTQHSPLQVKEQEWNVRVHANTQPWPQDSLVRRASVSSFGYGGTNGHVIVESVDNLYPWYQHGQPKKLASYDHSCKVPLLLCLSAHDKATLTRNIEAVSAVASEYYVADLAHTLNLHRTMFSNRSFVVARDGHVDEAFSHASQQTGLLPKRPTTNIGFLFTGQGVSFHLANGNHSIVTNASRTRHNGPACSSTHYWTIP